MLVGSLGRGIPRMWDPLWDSSGTHETCVGPHVTRDTHVGLVARGWLDCLVFSWVFNLACSSTAGGTDIYVSRIRICTRYPPTTIPRATYTPLPRPRMYVATYKHSYKNCVYIRGNPYKQLYPSRQYVTEPNSPDGVHIGCETTFR